MPSLRRSLRIAAVLATALASVRAAGAQTVTLPTVRAFGPGPEEAIMYRLLREVRADYTEDKTADSTERAAVTTRLDQLLLAAVTRQQLDRLAVASTERDTLEVLAGEKYMWNDRIPRAMRQAILALGGNAAACASIAPTRLKEIQQAAAQQAQRSMVAYGIREADAMLPKEVRDSLARQRPDSATLSRRSERVTCALEELRERDPARFLSEPITNATSRKDAARAARLDSLARVATQVVILRKLGVRFLFPITTRGQAQAFWRQRGVAPLNVGSVAGSSRSGVTFTELASPLLQTLRVSVNAVLASEKTDTTAGGAPKDTGTARIQRLLTGGGLLNVSFAYPLLYKGIDDHGFDVMLLAVPRLGATAPVLGATQGDTATLSLDAGLEFHTKYVDLDNGVGLVGQVRWSNARGSGRLIESLGIPKKNNVTYATGSVGFLFSGQYMVTASRAFGGPRAIRRTPWQVGLTVIRKPNGA